MKASDLTDDHWYIDMRPVVSAEHISLDLARHLPRRLAVGPVVIVADRPDVLLAVVRKRWSAITREVTRQFASTIDQHKRRSLQCELDHMRRCRFTTQPFCQNAAADCFFIAPNALSQGLPPTYKTLYIAMQLSATGLLIATQNLSVQGLIVSYGEWLQEYEQTLHTAFMMCIRQNSPR